ncbi:MAG: saccharopine dehydrogenase NADP-binding domain-containing protein [Candidatus Bathyarchaeota archaeon]|nr:saccharopine dehydrogenase NADP-binding domain-containing protein [Candidatus Bathyarchaeota archaeon]
MKIAVLGAGRQGAVAVTDLLDEKVSHGIEEVLIADIRRDAVDGLLSRVEDDRLVGGTVDASQVDETAETLRGYDATINLVWYNLNLHVMRACLKSGSHYTDAGGLFHMTRKQLELDDDFRRAGLTAALGCGGSPGQMNMLARIAADKLEEVDEIHIRLGSGPAVYTLHSETATLAQYIGKGCETVTFKQTLGSEMKEALKTLIALGLTSKDAVEVGGGRIVPYDVVIDIIEADPDQEVFGYSGRTIMDEFMIPAVEYVNGEFKEFEPLSGEEMLTFPEILGDQLGTPNAIAKGRIKGDPAISLAGIIRLGGTSRERARSRYGGTGPMVSITAQMMASGEIDRRGAYPPEALIDPSRYKEEMKKRGSPGFLETLIITKRT